MADNFMLVRMPVYEGVKHTSVTFHESKEEAFVYHKRLDGTWPVDFYIAEIVERGYAKRGPDVKARLDVEGARP